MCFAVLCILFGESYDVGEIRLKDDLDLLKVLVYRTSLSLEENSILLRHNQCLICGYNVTKRT